MRKIVFLCSVMNDGIGDLIHLEDLVSEMLKRPLFQEDQIVLIVQSHYKKSDRMFSFGEERLQKLAFDAKAPYFYGDFEDHISFSQTDFAHDFFAGADQIIVVSYHDGLINMYESMIGRGTAVKFIGEHERVSAQGLQTIRSLGLGPSCYGIKIKDYTMLEKEAAFLTIADQSPELYEQLLQSTGSAHWEDFDSSQNLMVSYFKCLQGFMTFAIMLSMNPSLLEGGKNLFIYLSGLSFNDFIGLECFEESQLEKLFRHSSIKKIHIVNREAVLIKKWGSGLAEDSACEKTLTILIGDQMSKKSFMALYDLSYLAGVSGDNSLEDCVSKKLLMFYWSTNYQSKEQTLRGLSHIIQKTPQLTRVVKADLQRFFSYENISSLYSLAGQWLKQQNVSATIRELRFHPLKNLNFSMMKEAWNTVVTMLRKKHNFYDYFEQILLERIDKDIIERRTNPVLYRLVPAKAIEAQEHNPSQKAGRKKK